MAGWKEHYSVYPVNGRLAEELKEQLEPYELGKGTLRLPLSQPVPEKLIARIAKLLARESVSGRTRSGGSAPAPPRAGHALP